MKSCCCILGLVYVESRHMFDIFANILVAFWPTEPLQDNILFVVCRSHCPMSFKNVRKISMREGIGAVPCRPMLVF